METTLRGRDVRQLMPLQVELASNARVNRAHLLARSCVRRCVFDKASLGTADKTAAESSGQLSD